MILYSCNSLVCEYVSCIFAIIGPIHRHVFSKIVSPTFLKNNRNPKFIGKLKIWTKNYVLALLAELHTYVAPTFKWYILGNNKIYYNYDFLVNGCVIFKLDYSALQNFKTSKSFYIFNFYKPAWIFTQEEEAALVGPQVGKLAELGQPPPSGQFLRAHVLTSSKNVNKPSRK